MAYVYRHIRLDKNIPFYIGIGADNKFSRAKEKARRSDLWKKIASKTDYEIEIVFDNMSVNDAKNKEIEFISLYGRIDLNTGSLANLTNGGEGAMGAVRSADTRKKMSDAIKGFKHTDEAKIKMSNYRKGIPSSFKGKFHTQEALLKISLAQAGRKNEKQVAAMRDVNIGNKRLVGYKQTASHVQNMINTKLKKVICITTGKEYDSPTSAAIDLKISRFGIYNVISGRRASVGGFKFKYIY